MERLYLPPEQLNQGEVRLTPEQAHYLTGVLRLPVGASLRVFDGVRFEYEARLVESSRRTACLHVGSPLREESPPPVVFTLAQGLPKQGKMETILQKAVELGVARLTPFCSAYGDVKPPKDSAARLARWRRVAEEACRQCGRIALPRLDLPLAFTELGEQMESQRTLMAYEHAALPLREVFRDDPPPAVMLVIGPEGGFREDEARYAEERGARLVSLGPRVLRTETAGPALLAVLQQVWGDWDRPRAEN